MDVQTFSWIDYTLFVTITSVSCFIGLYFGLYSKQKTATDYLLGGKKMKWLPVSLSLVSSSLSGHSVVGLATEVYLHGSQIFLMSFSNIFAILINYFLFLPVFCNLQLTNVFEYLEMRYSLWVKNFVMIILTITDIALLPLFMYSPSITFSQVSGVSIHIISPIMIAVCIFYTSFGGVKAVVWTDALQIIITFLTVITVIGMSFSSIGFSTLLNRANDGDRLKVFDFNPDPTARISFWTILLGYTISRSIVACVLPTEVQRYLSISKKSIKRSVTTYTTCLIVMKLMCMVLGLAMYGRYFDCDPKSNGQIKKLDQIVPLFITELTSKIPGFNGLFVAAFFGSALSIYSTVLNTLSGVIYNDMAPWLLPKTFLDLYPTGIMKIIVIILGLATFGLMFVLENVGTVFEASFYLKGITGGAFFGIFLLGVLVPFSNSKGAFLGGITAMLFMSITVINNQIYVWKGTTLYPSKPLQTYGCPNNATILNSTASPITAENMNEPFWLFKISFQYYDLIGTIITVSIGILISWLTKKKGKSSVKQDYLSPVVRRYGQKTETVQNAQELLLLNPNQVVITDR